MLPNFASSLKLFTKISDRIMVKKGQTVEGKIVCKVEYALDSDVGFGKGLVRVQVHVLPCRLTLFG